MEKKIKMATIKEASGPASRPLEDLRKSERKQPSQPLLDSTNTKLGGLKGSNKSKDDGSNDIESNVTDAGIEHDDFVQANESEGKEDVLIDDEDLPHSQNWFVSFNEYEE